MCAGSEGCACALTLVRGVGERDFDFRDMRDFEISGLSTDVNRGKNTDHIYEF